MRLLHPPMHVHVSTMHVPYACTAHACACAVVAGSLKQARCRNRSQGGELNVRGRAHTLVHPRWQLRLERVGCTRLERVLHCGRAQQSRRPEIRCLLYLPLVPVSFRTVTDTSWVSSVLQVPSRIHGCRHPVSDQTNLDASRWTQRRRRDAGVCAERYDGSVMAMLC